MMGRIGDDKIEEIRNRSDIVEVIGAHVRLKRAGRNFVGLCPFHNEKTPSFSVNPERGFFHCFGCGAGGTVFNFLMRMEALSFPEALRALAGRYGVVLPQGDEGGSSTGDREAMLRANQTAAEFFFHVLWNTPDGVLGRDYLKSRGVAIETARTFMLGFAPARPASLVRALEKRGLLEIGVKLGLVRREDGGAYDMFRARLMFPIRDPQARVIAFGGRVLDQRLPKYINSPESPLYSKARSLYGLYEARQAIAHADRAVVVEGYFDAISLWQAGFKEVVASLGTALTVEQLRIVSRYTRNVIACFDGDEAGRKASIRALEVFLGAGLLGRGAFIPAGFDPDTLIRERGAKTVEDLIAAAELLVDYFLRQQALEARASLSARAQAAQRVAELLRLVTNPFEFDLLARKAADLLGVGEDVLRGQALRGKNARNGVLRRPERVRHGDATAEAELGLLAIALVHPGLRAHILKEAPPERFQDQGLATLVGEVCRLAGSQPGFEALVPERLAAEHQSRLSALIVGPLAEHPENAPELAQDYIAALRRRGRLREVETFKRAAAAGTSDDEKVAAAQTVIALRREARSES
jgi:DNA primase